MTSTPIARLPLTDIEKTTLNNLVEVLKKTESKFCCGGTINIPSEEGLSLLYKIGSGKCARSIDLSAVGATDVEHLMEASVPAPHGRGSKTVYDESYRVARELPQSEFALTRDIVNPTGVLGNIAMLMSPRDPDAYMDPTGILENIITLVTPRDPTRNVRLIARMYKLNAYTTGGFFKPHRDTPKSDTHVGTVVVALPIPFEGGALRVSHDGRDTLFDWGAAASNAPELGVNLPWAFLFSDVEHEVLPVTSGTRITLAYDIFTSSMSSEPPLFDGATLPFYSDIEAMLKNTTFLPRGGKLGLALSHAYPAPTDSKNFESCLKGRDAALYRALLALQVNMTFCAVYMPRDSYYEEEADGPLPSDEFAPYIEGEDGEYLLYTSDSYKVVHGGDDWMDGETEYIKHVVCASLKPDIIWACKPTVDTFSEGGNYIESGEDASSLATIHVAAAVVFEVPKVKHNEEAILVRRVIRKRP